MQLEGQVKVIILGILGREYYIFSTFLVSFYFHSHHPKVCSVNFRQLLRLNNNLFSSYPIISFCKIFQWVTYFQTTFTNVRFDQCLLEGRLSSPQGRDHSIYGQSGPDHSCKVNAIHKISVFSDCDCCTSLKMVEIIQDLRYTNVREPRVTWSRRSCYKTEMTGCLLQHQCKSFPLLFTKWPVCHRRDNSFDMLSTLTNFTTFFAATRAGFRHVETPGQPLCGGPLSL